MIHTQYIHNTSDQIITPHWLLYTPVLMALKIPSNNFFKTISADKIPLINTKFATKIVEHWLTMASLSETLLIFEHKEQPLRPVTF